MDEKWVEQAGQDRRMIEDKAWLFRDWVAERSRQLRETREGDAARPGKVQWVVKHPALVVFPLLAFGACIWLLVIGLVAG